MSQGAPEPDRSTAELIEALSRLNINIHIHPTASASASATSFGAEPRPAADSSPLEQGPPRTSTLTASSSGGLAPELGPFGRGTTPASSTRGLEPPGHVLRLAGRLRAPHLSGISPEDRVRRAFRLGDWAIRKARGESVQLVREYVNLRNTCYAVVSGLDEGESFYTTSYTTYIRHVKPDGAWVRHLGSHGFSSLVEVEAFFAGAGLQGLPRCLA